MNEIQKDYVDPSVYRKKGLVESDNRLSIKDRFPMFTLVEINIFGACNRSCSFCPVSNPEVYTNANEGFQPELFSKLMDDLSSLDYKGTVLFSAFSEPFLHKQLLSLVDMVKQALPQARLEMITNGDTIKVRPEKLADVIAHGTDGVSISVYDGPREMEEFKSLVSELGLDDEKVFIRRRYYDPKEDNYGIIFSNRTGLVDSNSFDKNKREEELPLKKNCYYPFYQTLIDYNGDMILCPHDWEKRYIIGNITDSHVWDLWCSKKYNAARKLLAKENRNFPPCATCDVAGDIIGEQNFQRWLKLQNE